MFTIRRQTKEDAAAVLQLYTETIRQAPWMSAAAKESTDFSSLGEGETVIVCLREEELLGFISVYVEKSFIHHLYIAEGARGQGAGTALLQSLEAWLPFPWQLKCSDTNHSALAFYFSRGWENVGQGTGLQGDYFLLEYTA